MDIGIFGLSGMNLPGISFAGFETGFSEVAWRLAEEGHRVTIYCRRERYPADRRPPEHRGVKLVYCPTIETKNLSFVTSLSSALFAALTHGKHDVYLFANVGSGFHCLIAKLFGKKVALNVNGLDWKRAKWGSFARNYFRSAAQAALFSCDALITDADAMVDFYRREFNRSPEMISYGAYIEPSEQPELIEQYNLSPRDYYLVVARLVPENKTDLIIDAFKQLKTDKRLIVVGDANYDSPFHHKIRNSGDPRIIFTGWMNNRKLLKELYCNCYAYLHGHSVGGTNPALLTALGYGTTVLALNTPFNAEVLVNSDATYGLLWEHDVEDLRAQLQYVEDHPDVAEVYRQRTPERIRTNYTWEKIARQYGDLMQQVNAGRSDSKRRMTVLRLGMFLVTALVLLKAVFGKRKA